MLHAVLNQRLSCSGARAAESSPAAETEFHTAEVRMHALCCDMQAGRLTCNLILSVVRDQRG